MKKLTKTEIENRLTEIKLAIYYNRYNSEEELTKLLIERDSLQKKLPKEPINTIGSHESMLDSYFN